jgi:excisionase family DNA binding protein
MAISTDDLLSTGKAAEILGCSRQHVVDLCINGVIAFESVGTHRRVRRSAVEGLQSGAEGMRPEVEKSLWLGIAVAGKVVTDIPRAQKVVRQNVTKSLPVVRGKAKQWLLEWNRLAEEDIPGLLNVLVSCSDNAIEMRQNNPFAGLLTQQERRGVLDQWRSSHIAGKK